MTKGEAGEKEKVGISVHGPKQTKSTRRSALLTNPANRPVLVAKLRDDLMALEKAGFLVLESASRDKSYEMDGLLAVQIVIVAPKGDNLGYDGGYTYNGEKVQ